MCQDRSAGGLIDRGLGLRFMSSSVGWFFWYTRKGEQPTYAGDHRSFKSGQKLDLKGFESTS